MSSPDIVSEMGSFLEDNLATYLWSADRPALAEFVYKLMPHISRQGLSDIYPLVSACASFNPRSYTTRPAPTCDIGPDDEMPINYGGTT